MALIITAFAPRSTDQLTTSIKACAQNRRSAGSMVGNRRRRWRKMVQFEYDYVDCRRQALISGAVRPFRYSKFQVFRVLPDGCSRKARSEHRKGTALAALRSALEGKLSTDRDAPVLIPHLPETVQKGTSRPPATSRPPHATPGSYDTALARHRMSKENHGPPAFASLQRHAAGRRHGRGGHRRE